MSDSRRSDGTFAASTDRPHGGGYDGDFRAVFDHAPIGMAVVGLDERILDVNDALCRMLGYPRDELLAMDIPSLTHPADRDLETSHKSDLNQAAADHFEIEKRYLHRGGHTLWGRLTVSLVRDPEGQPHYYIGQLEDITARRTAEERLRQSQALWSKAFQASPALLTLSTLDDGTCLDVNEHFLRTSGYRRDELVGRPIDDTGLWAETGARDHVVAVVTRQGELRDHEMVMRTHAGELRHILVSARRVEIDGRACLLSAGLDITERKRAVEALTTQARVLESMSEGVSITDDRGFITFTNPAFDRMFGYGQGELIGKQASTLRIGGDTDARTDPSIVAALQRTGTWNGEFRNRAKDGSEFQTSAHISLLRFQDRTFRVCVQEDMTERRRAENMNARLGRILDQTSNEIYVFDADTLYFVQVNRGARDNLGYSTSELEEMTPLDIKPEYDRERLEALLLPLREEREQHITFRATHLRKNGTAYPVEVRLQLLRNESPPVFVAVIQDITDRDAAEARMAQLSSALEQSADLVMITDRDGVIEYVNPAFVETTRYDREQLIGKLPDVLKSGHHGPEFYRSMWKVILSGEVFREIFVNRSRDGSIFYEEKTITPLLDREGRITHFVSTGKDITERMQTQEKLRYLAHHDPLTELPNRSLFMDRLNQALAHARRHHWRVAVMFLDIDRFKIINDTLGHTIGDQVLQTIAQRLLTYLRDVDTVARLGGDEFAVILEDAGSNEDITQVARKLLRAVEQPFDLDARELAVTTSVGISRFPEDAEESQALLKNADVAMYRAKEQGRNTFQFYTADMNSSSLDRLAMEAHLRRALERREFVLHYQPQIDIRGQRIIGIEALLRWEHPELGSVSPASFVPLLEESGLITRVGEWVLETACAQLADWHRAGAADLRLAVNVSSRQLSDDSIVAAVERGLSTSGIQAYDLELEITESAIMERPQRVIENLRRLKQLGVRIALDDFGTGYSSLSYLRRFPIDTLKVDQSFIRDIVTDPGDATIVSTILAMAQNLDLFTVAEGVENDEQLWFLQERGCQSMQGFLFSPALPPDDVAGFFQIAASDAAH